MYVTFLSTPKHESLDKKSIICESTTVEFSNSAACPALLHFIKGTPQTSQRNTVANT